MLITENQGYKLFCETRKVETPEDKYYVRLYTKYDFAKNPDREQTKMELFLSSKEIEKLIQSLTS
jgi:hypothetical protein